MNLMSEIIITSFDASSTLIEKIKERNNLIEPSEDTIDPNLLCTTDHPFVTITVTSMNHRIAILV